MRLSWKCNLKNKVFLFKKDILAALKDQRNRLLFYVVFLILGVVIGVLIGIKVGEKEPPFGVFGNLFHLNFEPFSYIFPDFLRFFFFSILSGLSYFLPCPKLYPSISMVFFGKYFGQLACLVFLTDAPIAAIFSLALIYLPLLLLGGVLLFRVGICGEDSRLCRGADSCKASLKSFILSWIFALIAYFILLVLLYVALCGILYLIVISL